MEKATMAIEMSAAEYCKLCELARSTRRSKGAVLRLLLAQAAVSAQPDITLRAEEVSHA